MNNNFTPPPEPQPSLQTENFKPFMLNGQLVQWEDNGDDYHLYPVDENGEVQGEELASVVNMQGSNLFDLLIDGQPIPVYWESSTGCKTMAIEFFQLFA